MKSDVIYSRLYVMSNRDILDEMGISCFNCRRPLANISKMQYESPTKLTTNISRA